MDYPSKKIKIIQNPQLGTPRVIFLAQSRQMHSSEQHTQDQRLPPRKPSKDSRTTTGWAETKFSLNTGLLPQNKANMAMENHPFIILQMIVLIYNTFHDEGFPIAQLPCLITGGYYQKIIDCQTMFVNFPMNIATFGCTTFPSPFFRIQLPVGRGCVIKMG